tara:strand:+ start:1808 stop:2029 length:222 start_codon:yes stop_codon:yes gene_type:complete
MRTQDIEKTEHSIISDIYYNWDANMAKAFNGTHFPKDYPKDTQGVRHLELNGKAMGFWQFEDYCISNGIITKE